jgi:hypothetical protein
VEKILIAEETERPFRAAQAGVPKARPAHIAAGGANAAPASLTGDDDRNPGLGLGAEQNLPSWAPAGAPVGDRIIARGDVVIVDGGYGLRIMVIVQPRKRLESVQP